MFEHYQDDTHQEMPITQEMQTQESEHEEQPQEQPVFDKKAHDFKMLRENSERLRRERDEYARRLEEYEASKFKQMATHVEDDEELRLAPDEIAEGKHLSKVDKRVRKLEEQLRQQRQQTATSDAEWRLKVQYPDFDKVVTKENIEILSQAYPEIARTLNSSTDLYSTGSSAYTILKKLGIAQEDVYVQDRERAQKNAAKPRPLASVSPQQGESPLARANAFSDGLTSDLKAQLYREMMDARKKY